MMTCDDMAGEKLDCEVGIELSCVRIRNSDWCSIGGKCLAKWLFCTRIKRHLVMIGKAVGVGMVTGEQFGRTLWGGMEGGWESPSRGGRVTAEGSRSWKCDWEDHSMISMLSKWVSIGNSDWGVKEE